MKTYTVFGETIITRIYTVEAESFEEAIEKAQNNPGNYDGEDIDENWTASE